MAEKKYSFVGMHKGNKEGVAVGYLEGWVTRDLESRDGGGKPVTNSAIALNNVSKKLAYALATELPEGETTFVDIAGWEQVSERMNKVIKKGALVGLSGVLKVEEYEGKKRLRFTVQDFQIRVYPKNNETNASTNTESKELVGSGGPIEVSDDDLPF